MKRFGTGILVFAGFIAGIAFVYSCGGGGGGAIAAPIEAVGTEITSLPYTISSSGSYYLGGDLSSTGVGITVNADNVTIDLMGFTITGPGSGSDNGIYIGGRSNVEIRNGTVTDFGASGIASSGAELIQAINIRSISNSWAGILLSGTGNRIINSTAAYNANAGLYLNNGGTIINSTAYNNQFIGIYLSGNGGTVIGNTAYSNQNNGISVGWGVTVKNNSAYFNQNHGIDPSGYDLLDGNTTYANNQAGGSFFNIDTCATCTYGSNVAP